MRRILRADYAQQHLLPPSIEEWVGPRHPARYIREFVQELDLRELGLKQPNEVEGGECYAPELLLAVWLYGYWRKIRTTRGLEDACRQDLGFLYLSGNHRPDHQALWRFWADNQQVLRGIFKRTVQVALKLKLVEMVTQVLDGTKIEAACSHWGFHHERAQRQLLAKLETIVAELEAAIAQAPPVEQRVVMEAQLAKEQNLRSKVRAALAEIEAGEAQQVHREEKEARRMKMPGRNRFAYNAQVMVDAAQSVITAQEVVNQENDLRQLWPMMQAAEEVTGQAAPNTVADTGYSSAAQLAQAMEGSSSQLCISLPQPQQNAEQNPYHCSQFKWDAARDVVTCPQGRDLAFHHQRKRGDQLVRVYRDQQACADCPVRSLCTQDRHGRSIDVGPYLETVNAHREQMQEPWRQELVRKRGSIVERVFGQIKGHWQMQRWTVKGLVNVRTQWDLLCTTWNLTRLFSTWKNNPQGFRAACAA